MTGSSIIMLELELGKECLSPLLVVNSRDRMPGKRPERARERWRAVI